MFRWAFLYVLSLCRASEIPEIGNMDPAACYVEGGCLVSVWGSGFEIGVETKLEFHSGTTRLLTEAQIVNASFINAVAPAAPFTGRWLVTVTRTEAELGDSHYLERSFLFSFWNHESIKILGVEPPIGYFLAGTTMTLRVSLQGLALNHPRIRLLGGGFSLEVPVIQTDDRTGLTFTSPHIASTDKELLMTVWFLPNAQETIRTNFSIPFHRRDPFDIAVLLYNTQELVGWSQAVLFGSAVTSRALGTSVRFTDHAPIQGPEAANEIGRRLISTGVHMIIAVHFSHRQEGGLVELVNEFPDVKFVLGIDSTLHKSYPNLGTCFGRLYEGRYITGIVAGAMSKSGIIAYISSLPIAQTARQISAFALGARLSNPNVTILVRYSMDWNSDELDVYGAYDLMARGADVLTQNTNGLQAQRIFGAAGLLTIGIFSDYHFLGDFVLCSSFINWGPAFLKYVGDMIRGEFKGGQIWGGFADDMITVSNFASSVPQDVQALALYEQHLLKTREKEVFCGPIWDLHGNLAVAQGRCLTDAELDAPEFDLLVEGVVDLGAIIPAVCEAGKFEFRNATILECRSCPRGFFTRESGMKTCTPDAVNLLPRSMVFAIVGGSALALVVALIITLIVIFVVKLRASQRKMAQTAAAVKEQLVASMSHEIRTPLHGMCAIISILKESVHEENHALLKLLDISTSRLQSVVDRILDFSKTEYGLMSQSCTRVNSNDLIEEVLLDARSHLQQSGHVDICYELGDELWRTPIISCDKEKAVSVLRILVENAIKFIPESRLGQVVVLVTKIRGPALRRTKANKKKWSNNTLASCIQVSVKDTGIGIPDNKKGQIFESFAMIHKADHRSYGGLGLGMALAANLVRALKGQIWLESSEVDVGTEFCVILPVDFVGAPAANASYVGHAPSHHRRVRTLDICVSPSIKSTPAAVHLQNWVLIVDRNQTVLQTLAKHVERLGAAVDVTTSLQVAMNLVKTGKYKLVFLHYSRISADPTLTVSTQTSSKKARWSWKRPGSQPSRSSVTPSTGSRNMSERRTEISDMEAADTSQILDALRAVQFKVPQSPHLPSEGETEDTSSPQRSSVSTFPVTPIQQGAETSPVSKLCAMIEAAKRRRRGVHIALMLNMPSAYLSPSLVNNDQTSIMHKPLLFSQLNRLVSTHCSSQNMSTSPRDIPTSGMYRSIVADSLYDFWRSPSVSLNHRSRSRQAHASAERGALKSGDSDCSVVSSNRDDSVSRSDQRQNHPATICNELVNAAKKPVVLHVDAETQESLSPKTKTAPHSGPPGILVPAMSVPQPEAALVSESKSDADSKPNRKPTVDAEPPDHTSAVHSAGRDTEKDSEKDSSEHEKKPQVKPSGSHRQVKKGEGQGRQKPSRKPLGERVQRKRRVVRILIAEDNRINRMVMLQLLRRIDAAEKLVVEVATNGQETVDAIEAATTPFNIILMDVQMPQMGGIEATEIIRARLKDQSPCIIAVSAAHNKRDKCEAAGMDDFLSKPVQVGQLQHMLCKHKIITKTKRRRKHQHTLPTKHGTSAPL